MSEKGPVRTVFKRTAYGILLLLVCVFIYSDIDVGVPPGAGYEWVFQMPRATPNSYRTQVRRDSTGPVGTAMAGYVLDVFSYAKIITVDITRHLNWLKAGGRYDKPQDPNELYTLHGNKILEKYPPKVPRDTMWLALAGYLRNLLHTANATLADATAYLIYLGDISLEAAKWAESEPSLKDLVSAIRRLVPPAGDVGPVLKDGRNLYETTMLRITWEDLAMAYPFSFEQRFASRLDLLGKDALPFIIEATKSKHLFLQRNATLQLSKYDLTLQVIKNDVTQKAVERMRELFIETKDAVVRYRALDGLIRVQDKASVNRALELLETEDKLLQPYLVYALGMIGDQKAVELICLKLEKNLTPENYDLVVACVQALGRLKFNPNRTSMTEEDKMIIEILKKAEAEADKFKDPEPKMAPDNPDRPNIWRDTIKESVWLSLAAMGEKEYLKKYEEQIKVRLAQFATPDVAKRIKEMEEKLKEMGERLKTLKSTSQEYRDLQRDISTVRMGLMSMKHGSIAPVTELCPLKVVYFMIDMLSDLQEYEIIKGMIKVVEESVASYALQRFFNSKDEKGKEIIIKDKDFLISLIDMKADRPQVAATALGILFDIDLKDGQKAAQGVVDGYPENVKINTQFDYSKNRNKPIQSPEAKRFVVAYALKLLCDSNKKLKAEKLKSIIENEEKERAKRKGTAHDPNPGIHSRIDNPIIVPPAPLLEYAVVELGRLRDSAQEEYLIAYLKNKDSSARAEACVALAAINTKKCKQVLVDSLEDKDGWIRFCAYRALMEIKEGNISKIEVHDKEFNADWLYEIGQFWPYNTEQGRKEAEQQRKDAVKRWREWLEAQE